MEALLKHRNDIYGDDTRQREGGNKAIPAATVVLLRDAPELEVLMLHKTSKVAFGGMWVFPGGRVDDEDYPANGDADTAARHAAARETREEAGIVARPDDFVWFAHWTPPPSTPRRFATWFFAAAADNHVVQVDGGEIQNHEWLRPGVALERHAAAQIALAPPTWITLHQLSLYPSCGAALARLQALPTKIFQTRVAQRVDGVRVAMWHGDAGYELGDADAAGERHRLVLCRGGFVFENTVEVY
jgi:8-oxo-dGTP pyrophosphatase MutT (NUDIX family)